MSFIKRCKLSESTQILSLLSVILFLLLFFAVSTALIFQQIISDRRDIYLLEDSFELTEYHRLLEREEKMRVSVSQLQERINEFRENDYIRSMKQIQSDFREKVEVLDNNLRAYLALLRGQDEKPIEPELVETIQKNLDSINAYMYRHKRQQVETLQMMNIFILMSFFLVAAITLYTDNERKRQLRLKEGLRFLNRRNLFEYENGSKRISYTIHDHVLQDLEMTRMALETLTEDAVSSDMRERVSMMRGSLAESIRKLRDILSGLPVWDTISFSFENNLRNLVDSVRPRIEGEVKFQSLGMSKVDLSRREMEQMLSILHEALYNVVKHSRAAYVRVRAIWAQPVLKIFVEDDGVGFSLREMENSVGSHLGFLSMQERAHSIGAKLEIRSNPGKGSRIIVELEKEREG